MLLPNFHITVAQINKNNKPARGYLLMTHDPRYSLDPFMAKFTDAGFGTEFFRPSQTPLLLKRLATLTAQGKPVAIISEQGLPRHGSDLDANGLRAAAKKIDPQCYYAIYSDTHSDKNNKRLPPKVGKHVIRSLDMALDALAQLANQSKIEPQIVARPSVAAAIRNQPSWVVEPSHPMPGYPVDYPLELRRR